MSLYNQSNIEGWFCLAINAFKTGQIKSIYAAIYIYAVPLGSLCTRYHGTPS